MNYIDTEQYEVLHGEWFFILSATDIVIYFPNKILDNLDH